MLKLFSFIERFPAFCWNKSVNIYMKLKNKEKIEVFVTIKEKEKIKLTCEKKGWKISEFIRRGIDLVFEKIGEK